MIVVGSVLIPRNQRKKTEINPSHGYRVFSKNASKCTIHAHLIAIVTVTRIHMEYPIPMALLKIQIPKMPLNINKCNSKQNVVDTKLFSVAIGYLIQILILHYIVHIIGDNIFN